MFAYFERLIPVTGEHPGTVPPGRLLGFYLFFIRQVRSIFALLLIVSLALAVIDILIPIFTGKLIYLLTVTPRPEIISQNWPTFAAMVIVVTLVRPIVMGVYGLAAYQAIMPGWTNMIRWQSHCHVMRRDLSFFHRDLAGRLGGRVVGAGFAVRTSTLSTVSVLWYLLALAFATLTLASNADLWLGLPIIIWIVSYAGVLGVFIRRVGTNSPALAKALAQMTGRVVDSYSNISTLKIFASELGTEDAHGHVREAIDKHTVQMQLQMRWFTFLSVGLAATSGFLIVVTSGTAILLWSQYGMNLEQVVTIIPLTLQVSGVANRAAFEIASIFEHVGTVADCLNSISYHEPSSDALDDIDIEIAHGAIEFRNVTFGYLGKGPVLKDVDLSIPPGQRIGIVGESGQGKTTLVNLLLRLYRPEGGVVLVDGIDLAKVNHASLMREISVITQDVALLHRSVYDNIRLGRPDCAMEDVIEAAKLAHAHDFILNLSDEEGRSGYDAVIGDRGMTLSGGQRQRIGIARAILKDARIIVLDEATSALDAQTEDAVQATIEGLTVGKTVLAVAHRLATLTAMDRIIVLHRGRIVEDGSHKELLSRSGRYSALWKRQHKTKWRLASLFRKRLSFRT